MITTKLYLDTRLVNANGESVLKIRLTENRKTAYISTSIKIDPRTWDGRRVINNANLNNIIRMYYESVRAEVIRLELSGQLTGLSIVQVRDRVLRSIKGCNDVDGQLFLDAYRKFGESRKGESTRNRYKQLIQHITAFDECIEKKTFDDIDTNWVKSFHSYLLTSCNHKVNSANIYINQIKAVFNSAIEDEITNNNPFRKIKLKNEQTMKRSLNVEQLRMLANAKFKHKSQEMARDYFMLVFTLCGINAVDLARVASLNGDRIEYIRSKTKKPVSIKVEPEAMAIIDKYRGTNHLVDILDRYNNHISFSATITRIIRDGLFVDASFPAISLYWARHSWATIAAELDIPKEVIGQALSHSANSVTDVYIAFNRKKIDDANRKVIDYVFHGIK